MPIGNIDKLIMEQEARRYISHADKVISEQKVKYYVLNIKVYGEDWEDEEKEISISRSYLEEYKEAYDNQYKRNGKYIPNISSIEYEIEEYTDEEIRNVATFNEYMKLRPDLEKIFLKK